MSDPARAFTPGFAGRTRVAENVLQRAFGGGEPVSFAASEVEQIGRRRRATDAALSPQNGALIT